jgi:hypothetical protein
MRASAVTAINAITTVTKPALRNQALNTINIT